MPEPQIDVEEDVEETGDDLLSQDEIDEIDAQIWEVSMTFMEEFCS